MRAPIARSLFLLVGILAAIDASLVISNQTVLMEFDAVFLGRIEDAPVNITAHYCITADYPCEPLQHTMCDTTAPFILIVSPPNCQLPRMRWTVENSLICDINDTSRCVPATSLLRAIVYYDPSGSALGYDAITKWTDLPGPVSVPLYTMALDSYDALRQLPPSDVWLTLLPGRNQWLEFYATPGFLAASIISAIFAGVVICGILYAIGKYIFVDRRYQQQIPVVKLVYLSIELVANVLRLVCCVGALSSGSWFDWTVEQFFVSINPGLTMVGALLVPVHIFPLLTKKVIPSKKLTNAMLGVYLAIAGCLVVFIITRPISVVAFSDNSTKEWAGWLVFIGYLFIAAFYNVFIVLCLVGIRRRRKIAKRTDPKRTSSTRDALKRIGVLLAVTTGLLLLLCAFFIEAVIALSFLRPQAYAITTFVHFNLLTAISLVQQFHFRSSVVNKAAEATQSEKTMGLSAITKARMSTPSP